MTVSYKHVLLGQLDDIRCGELRMHISSFYTYRFIHL